MSEQVLECELHGPRSAPANVRDGADETRGGLIVVAVRQQEVRMIENIEDLGAEYSAEAFMEVHLFLQRKVKLRDIRGANDAVASVAIP